MTGVGTGRRLGCEDGNGSLFTFANAIYNLAVHHQTRSNPDAAREHFWKVIDEFPDSHWAEYARKRIADLPEATGDVQPQQ